MAWALVLWTLFFLKTFALLAMVFYQLLCVTDLEADHINPFEATTEINRWVIPEFVLQGVLCLLFLLTGHWIMFLLALPLTCYHVIQFMKRQHLIDVTEVFRNINVEKKCRMVKLVVYLLFATIIISRFVWIAFEVIRNQEDDDHAF